MAIQNRRGVYTDFDVSKMVAGEIAVVQSGDPSNTDGKAIYIAFQNGSVARLVLASEMGSLSSLETTAKTSIVDAINELTEKSSILYGSTTTAGADRDKVVVCEDFVRTDGALIIVSFSQTNTVNNARLNINGTGVCNIYNSQNANVDTSWLKKGYYLFRYYSTNGGRYTLVGALERIPSDDAPLMDGTASAGTSDKYSRGDHVHPKDTSKADVTALQAEADARAAKDTELDGKISDVKDDLSDLNDYKFDELFSELDVSEQQNLYDASTVTNGYIAANGNISSSDTYCYSSKIPVKVGNTYTFWALYNGNVVSANARFLCAYDSENNAVSASGSNSAVASYTVPNGIASIVVSFEQTRKLLFMVIDGTMQPDMLLPYNIEHYIAKNTFINDAVGNILRNDEQIKMSLAEASANTEYKIVDHLDNKKNCGYTFFGQFDSFTSIEIGHGKTESGANYLVIDDTNITSYRPDGTEYAHYAHGLTISDFISVSIKVADSPAQRATVTIITNGGFASIGNVIFFGCNGAIYSKCGQDTSNVEFAYNIMDLRKDVYIFGDSYISLADDKRWPNYAIANNDNNFLLSGFPGANVQDEYPSFEKILSMGTPKYLCWFLGMNNRDATNAIDSNWVFATSQVILACKKKGIVPILATIPNTPTQRNSYKNAWVKASGERYVDFAKAVGAEASGSSWYNGMLSSDNVHPTAEGAKALWLRLRLDVPEVMQSTTT